MSIYMFQVYIVKGRLCDLCAGVQQHSKRVRTPVTFGLVPLGKVGTPLFPKLNSTTTIFL